MGIVVPPWITEEWFLECPNNYCDHFGDHTELSKICRVCRMSADYSQAEVEWRKYIKKTAYEVKINDHDLEHEINNTIAYFKSLEDEIDNMAQGYSIIVYQVIKIILRLYPYAKADRLLFKAYNVLAHSEHYVWVKIKRAKSSRLEERKSLVSRELADSRTSALFAYMAVRRNAKATRRLSKLKVSALQKE